MEPGTVSEFLTALAAKQPTPGGGSASALGGAMGAALACMAANYTVGNEKYAAFSEAAGAALAGLEALRAELLLLMEDDIAAYESYRAAMALSKNSSDEKQARRIALADARERSTLVPERILAAALRGLETVDALSRAVNPNLAGDVASSAYFFEACARGAAIQIVSNCSAPDAAGANAQRRGAANAAVARCQEFREKIHLSALAMIDPAP